MLLWSYYQPWGLRAAPGSSESAPQSQQGADPAGWQQAGQLLLCRSCLLPPVWLAETVPFQHRLKSWHAPIASLPWYTLLTESLGVVVQGG